MSHPCSHTDAITRVRAPRDVCEACVEIGGEWVHLRQCLECGRTLCCNSSPNQHMSGHFRETAHPVMRGAMPGDAWTWCFVDDANIREAPGGWETYDPYLEAGATAARDHLRSGGTADPSDDLVTPEGFPLGEWFAYVRDAHEEGALDERDEDLVESIDGWRW